MKLNGAIGGRSQGDLPLVQALGLHVGTLIVLRGFIATRQEGCLHRFQVLFTEIGLSGDDAGEVSTTDPLVLSRSCADLIGLALRLTGDANGGCIVGL